MGKRIFDTVADVGSIVMASIYFIYVGLLLMFGLGVLWLNYVMLGITLLYLIFFIIKMFTFNLFIVYFLPNFRFLIAPHCPPLTPNARALCAVAGRRVAKPHATAIAQSGS